MIDIRLISLALIMVFTFVACDNSIDLVEEGGDIPIVYAIVTNSEEDTAQYFRVERGFIDPTESALVIAKNPDSLFYDAPMVTMINKATNETYVMEEVDGNLEGYVREEGVFAQSPNTLFKIKNEDFELQENVAYELNIDRGEGLPLVTATTTIIEMPIITRPTESGLLSFSETVPTSFTWRAEDNLDIFDIDLEFYYDEFIDGVLTNEKIIYSIEKGTDESLVERDAVDFFTFVQSKIDVVPDAIRVFRKIKVNVTSGSPELSSYIRVVQANVGITSSQEIPTYSNLSEGFGIFGNLSRASRDNILLVPTTLDSLKNGRFTNALNFQ